MEKNIEIIKGLDEANDKIASDPMFENSKGVLKKLRSANLGYLHWNKDILLLVFPCYESCEDVRDEVGLFCAKMTLRMVENEIKIRELRGDL